jgi:hypothetical protein
VWLGFKPETPYYAGWVHEVPHEGDAVCKCITTDHPFTFRRPLHRERLTSRASAQRVLARVRRRIERLSCRIIHSWPTLVCANNIRFLSTTAFDEDETSSDPFWLDRMYKRADNDNDLSEDSNDIGEIRVRAYSNSYVLGRFILAAKRERQAAMEEDALVFCLRALGVCLVDARGFCFKA